MLYEVDSPLIFRWNIILQWGIYKHSGSTMRAEWMIIGIVNGVH